MGFVDDERAQAMQIGFILLFGVAVISFATYQAVVVPSQNEQVEFKHDEKVTNELLDLRNEIVSARSGGGSVSVALGTEYPSRALFRNPPAPSGALRTVDTGNSSRNLTIQNATAPGEVGDFWNGTAHRYPTGGFVYTPNYNEYSGSGSTYFENTVLFSQTQSADVAHSGQRIVEGRHIQLVSFNGSTSTTRSGTVSLDVRAVSAPEQTVAIRNDTRNITISFPTRLSMARWRSLLEGEFVDQGGHVVGLRNRSLGGGVELLSIDLEPDVTYNLQMAKVGFGTGIRPPETGYVLPAKGNGMTIQDGGSQRLVVEVRDRYNNPVSGESVNASVVSGGGEVIPISDVTDANGHATFRYEAPESPTTARIEANISSSPTAAETTEFEVNVISSGPDGITFTSGQAVDDPNSDGMNSGVQFRIANYDSRDANLTSITVESNGQAQEIQEADSSNNGPFTYEVYVNTKEDGWAEAGLSGEILQPASSYDLGEEISLLEDGQNAILASNGGFAEITLYEFQKRNGDSVDMTGEEITVTLSFADRPDEEFTFSG